jgi:hypothetical protein
VVTPSVVSNCPRIVRLSLQTFVHIPIQIRHLPKTKYPEKERRRLYGPIQTGKLMHLKSASGRFGSCTCSRHVSGSKLMGGANDNHIHSIDMNRSNPSHPKSGMYPYPSRTPVESEGYGYIPLLGCEGLDALMSMLCMWQV